MLLTSLNLVYLHVILVGKAHEELIISHFSNSNKNNETISCGLGGEGGSINRNTIINTGSYLANCTLVITKSSIRYHHRRTSK